MKSVTPSGVGHRVETLTSGDYSLVMKSVTPSGVGHPLPESTARAGRRDEVSDAVRRWALIPASGFNHKDTVMKSVTPSGVGHFGPAAPATPAARDEVSDAVRRWALAAKAADPPEFE